MLDCFRLRLTMTLFGYTCILLRVYITSEMILAMDKIVLAIVKIILALAQRSLQTTPSEGL
jgi:hypothetical protein